jgi:plastocyanin
MTHKMASALAALVLLGAAASAPSQPPRREHVIVMRNMSYGPAPAGIRVGDTILWVNRDNVPHTATARNRSFNVNVPQGRSVRMPVRQAGTFAYYCIYHPAMRGTLSFAP